jgi:hypothetical protein
MNALTVFKMELYKAFHDKPFITAAIALAIGNAIVSALLFGVFRGPGLHASDSGLAVGVSILLVFALLLFIGTIIFSFLYPLRLFSLDYRNHVMSLMIASGVGRVNLYISKVFAVLIATMALILGMTLVPWLILFSNTDLLSSSLNMFMNMSVNGLYTVILMFFIFIFSTIATLVGLWTAVVMMKGKYISILVYWLMNLVFSVVSVPVTVMFTFTNGNSLTESSLSPISIVASLLRILVFGLIGIHVIKKQRL